MSKPRMPFSSLAAFAAATRTENDTAVANLRKRRITITQGDHDVHLSYPGIRRWHEVVCEAITLRLTALVIPLLLIQGLNNITPTCLHAAFHAARDQPALQLRLTAVTLAHAHAACKRRNSRKRRAPAASAAPAKRRAPRQQGVGVARTTPSQLSPLGNASAPSASETLQVFNEVMRGVPDTSAGIHARLLTALADLVASAEHNISLPVMHSITCDDANLPVPAMPAQRPITRRSAKVSSQSCQPRGQMGCVAAVLALIEALPAAIESADPAFASVACLFRTNGLLQSAARSLSCHSSPTAGRLATGESAPDFDSDALSDAMTSVLWQADRPCAAAVAACLVALGASPTVAMAQALQEGNISALPALLRGRDVNTPLAMRNVCPSGCVALIEDYPLSHAVRLHDSALVQWLLGAGADANAASLVSGKTPMQELVTGRLSGIAWYMLRYDEDERYRYSATHEYLDDFRAHFTGRVFKRLRDQPRKELSGVPLELGRCALALLDAEAAIRDLNVPAWVLCLVGAGRMEPPTNTDEHLYVRVPWRYTDKVLSRHHLGEAEDPILGEVIARSIAAGSAVGHEDVCYAVLHQMHWAITRLACAGVLDANTPDPSTCKSLAYMCLTAQCKRPRATFLALSALVDAGADLTLVHEEWAADPAQWSGWFPAVPETLAEGMLMRSIALGDLPYFERLLAGGLPKVWVSQQFTTLLQLGQGTGANLQKTSPLLCLRAMQAGMSMDCCILHICTPFILALALQNSRIHWLDCLDTLKGHMAGMKAQGEMWQGGTLQHTCRLLNTYALTTVGVDPLGDVLQWLPAQVKCVAQTALLCMEDRRGHGGTEGAEMPRPPLPNDCKLRILQLALGGPLCLIQHLCTLPAGQPCPLPIPFVDA